MARGVLDNKYREFIPQLITDDLGYCCLQKFFTLYPNASLVAARLGVSENGIKKIKKHILEGQWLCNHNEKCLNRKEAHVTLADQHNKSDEGTPETTRNTTDSPSSLPPVRKDD